MKDFLLAIRAYGGKCNVCGEKRPIALELHHPKGIKEKEKPNRKDDYAKLRHKRYKPKRVILCGTCHLIHHRKEVFAWHTMFDEVCKENRMEGIT